MIEQPSTQSEKKSCPHLAEEFQPFVNPQLDDPYPFYKRARSEEPIFHSPLVNAYVVTRYEDILTVLKDPVQFSSAESLQAVANYAPEVLEVLRQGFPFVSLINSDGEQHKRLSAPFIKAFAPERLAVMEDSIRAIANRLVDSFVKDGGADILTKFAYPLTIEVILSMYGFPLEKMSLVKQCGTDTTILFASPLPPERQLECARNYVTLQQLIAGLIEERRIAPRNDLIGDLLTSDLNLGELVMLLCEMVIAGHKTTGNLIGKALKLLLDRPELWQAICDNASVIPTALEEVLRYDAPSLSIIRTTTQEVSLAGVTLPKGTRILLLFGSANYDQTQFSNAERFEIERFKQTTVKHLSFGHGVHHCIGSNLARREARIALEVLSLRLLNLRLRPNQQLTHTPSLLNRAYTHLDLEWDVA